MNFQERATHKSCVLVLLFSLKVVLGLINIDLKWRTNFKLAGSGKYSTYWIKDNNE